MNSDGLRQVVFKVILIGSSDVGKTCIIHRYVKNVFDKETKNTIGVDCSNKLVTVNELWGSSFLQGNKDFLKNVMLHIWDTTGQEMFKSINKMFYRGSNGVGLVFDLTCTNSFNSLDTWLNEFITSQGQDNPDLSEFAFVLIGNKVDLPDPKVTDEQVEKWMKE